MIALSPQILLYDFGDGVPAISSRLTLAQIPSPAFGDGSHPTTRLCAVAVDFLCRIQAIPAFLDVGTGTGILARIARARGASFVAGTDIDLAALDAARRNADLDKNTTPIAFDNVPPDHWGPRFDLVAANILEGPLHDLAPLLAAALMPGGQLLLSGFTRLQTPALRVHYERLGLRVLSESENQGWALLHLESFR